ncbi:MAG: hypothetical protein ACTS10_04060 [Kiloniellales bacterium]
MLGESVRYTVFGFAAMLGVGAAHANTTFDDRVNDINARYEQQYAALQFQAQGLKDEMPDEGEMAVGVDCDVDWVRQEIIFKTPTVTMKERHLTYDIAQVTMKLREFSFDRPVLKWGTTRAGPVKLHLPKLYTETVRWSTEIPEFRWDETTTVMHVPEFSTELEKIAYHAPEFVCDEASDTVAAVRTKADGIADQIEVLQIQQRVEIDAVLRDQIADALNNLDATEAKAVQQFLAGIGGLNGSIDAILAGGLNPENVDGRNLVAERDALRAKQEEALKAFQKARANLEERLTQLSS